jgi:hypothetical protein
VDVQRHLSLKYAGGGKAILRIFLTILHTFIGRCMIRPWLKLRRARLDYRCLICHSSHVVRGAVVKWGFIFGIFQVWRGD